MLTHVLNPANHHLRLFLGADWTPRSDAISYGHDIEFSWLLPEAAGVLGDPLLIAKTNAVALEIARTTLSEGIDTDGGVAEEGSPAGITDRSKEWWPQAEAAIGFLNAYQISGDPVFLRASLRAWDFIDTRIIDRKNGEWFQGLTKAGAPSRQPKVSFWKCPYHNSRACLSLSNASTPCYPGRPRPRERRPRHGIEPGRFHIMSKAIVSKLYDSDVFRMACRQFDKAADAINLPEELRDRTKYPRRCMAVALPDQARQRHDSRLRRLPRAAQPLDRTVKGRAPFSPARHAGRGCGPGDVDELEMFAGRAALRRRQGRRDRRSRSICPPANWSASPGATCRK